MRAGSLSIFILILITGGMNSCKPRKTTQVPPLATVKSDSGIAQTAESIISPSLKSWTYFSSKVSLDYKGGDNKVSATAHIRMYKDSLIWISAGMFGVEGMRILVTKDSIAILYKLEKSYTVLKNSDLGSFSDIPLSVTQMQNLILGRPLYALNLYQILKNDSLNLNIEYTHPKFLGDHFYKKAFLTIDSTMVKDRSTPNYARASYSAYEVVEGHNFPAKSEVIITGAKQDLNINLEQSEADFSTELSFPFNIPASYERKK